MAASFPRSSLRRQMIQGLSAWPLISWSELLRLVLEDLERRPRRTLLTMLGLVIGSAAVVAGASVGLAGRDYAIQQLDTLGTNFMWVSYHGPTDESAGAALGTRGRELSERDFQDIQENVSALAAASRVLLLYTTVVHGG